MGKRTFLILFWVGLMALFRGFTQIVMRPLSGAGHCEAQGLLVQLRPIRSRGS